MQDSTIDKYPADYLIGPYKKYDLSTFELKPGDQVPLATIKTIEQREGFTAESGDIILLQYGWDKYFQPETTNQATKNWWGINSPGLSKDVCRYFAEAHIRAIGIRYLRM